MRPSRLALRQAGHFSPRQQGPVKGVEFSFVEREYKRGGHGQGQVAASPPVLQENARSEKVTTPACTARRIGC